MLVNSFEIFVDVHTFFEPLTDILRAALHHDLRAAEHAPFGQRALGLGGTPDILRKHRNEHQVGIQRGIDCRNRLIFRRGFLQAPTPSEDWKGLRVPINLLFLDPLSRILRCQKIHTVLCLDLIRIPPLGLTSLTFIIPIRGKSVRFFCLKILQDQGLALGRDRTLHHEAPTHHQPDRETSPDHHPSPHTTTPFGFYASCDDGGTSAVAFPLANSSPITGNCSR